MHKIPLRDQILRTDGRSQSPIKPGPELLIPPTMLRESTRAALLQPAPMYRPPVAMTHLPFRDDIQRIVYEERKLRQARLVLRMPFDVPSATGAGLPSLVPEVFDSVDKFLGVGKNITAVSEKLETTRNFLRAQNFDGRLRITGLGCPAEIAVACV
ncbi:hypothetical protein B0H11DRAFT_1934465 [Mycena galericulata]|nr:hypothetical protein B0H11DRAFT_1934465 [Mycena galericulata]